MRICMMESSVELPSVEDQLCVTDAQAMDESDSVETPNEMVHVISSDEPILAEQAVAMESTINSSPSQATTYPDNEFTNTEKCSKAECIAPAIGPEDESVSTITDDNAASTITDDNTVSTITDDNTVSTITDDNAVSTITDDNAVSTIPDDNAANTGELLSDSLAQAIDNASMNTAVNTTR